MARDARRYATILTLVAVINANATPALACACCSHTAWRYVEVEKLGPQRLADIERMDFAKTAKLMTTEADINIKGISEPSIDYQIDLARRKDRMAFALRDAKGRAGSLVL